MVSCEATLERELIMLVTVHALRDDSGSFAEVLMKIIISFHREDFMNHQQEVNALKR